MLCGCKGVPSHTILLQVYGSEAQKAQPQFRGRDVTQLWNTSFANAEHNWPLGSHSTLCQNIAPANASTLAIVGNGPVTAEQRRLIHGMDRVVRFNAANNMCAELCSCALCSSTARL